MTNSGCSHPFETSTLEWVPYSFYHDRFKPFESDGAYLIYVIGLFRDGACEQLITHVDADGCMQMGVPGSDGGYWYSFKTRGLDSKNQHSCLVRIVNPFDVVAIARVNLPVSGLQHLHFEGRRSYILVEQPIPEPDPFGEQFANQLPFNRTTGQNRRFGGA